MSERARLARLLPFLGLAEGAAAAQDAAPTLASEEGPAGAPGQARGVLAGRAPRTHRSIFLSDLHLGTRGCKARLLLEFLRQNDAETIYLVGDIIDGWRLRRAWTWEQSHNDVVQKLLRKVRKGTRLVLLPGNHDEFLRDFKGMTFGGISIEEDCIHETAAGARYLVLHGDLFDGVVRHAKWLALLGDQAYRIALEANRVFNFVRRKLGLPYWSLSAFLKFRVKNAFEFMSRFEEALSAEARRRGADGVICGHIHHASMREIDGIHYVNDGDWVESCTALVEDFQGRLEILRWGENAEMRDRREGALAVGL